MTRTIVPALLLLMASPAWAHHAYGDIARDQTVVISGVIEHINFANPHVLLQVRADDGVVYTVEWGNLTQLARDGVTRATFQMGERLIVTGNPHRDPEKRLVTLLTEVRRPADGWQWTRWTKGVVQSPR